MTYQVAHDDLAITSVGVCLGGSGLVRGGARVLRCLLDTANRRGGCGATIVASLTLAATAGTGGATTSRKNVVERLVKLSRHDEDGKEWSARWFGW